MISYQALREFLRQSVLARVGFIAGLILVVAALLAPWIAPADPAAQNLPARLESPWRAHFAPRFRLRRLRLRSHRTNHGYARWIRRWLVGPHYQSLARQCVSFLSGNPPGHCVRGVSRSRHRQSDLGARHYRLGRLRQACTRAGAESQRNGIRTGRAIARRFSPAHHGGTSAAQHFAAYPDSSHYWYGRRHSRGIDVEFSRAWRAGTYSQLGSDAE